MAYLNNIQSHTLAEFLDSPARPAGTMTLHELRGFLWGLASAPTDIAEEDWFPLVFAGEEPGFRDVQEEDHILLLTLGLWDEQFSRIEAEDSPLAADEYRWHPDPAEAWPLAAWCTGLLKAHYWQEEAWENLLVQTEPVETEDGIFDIAEEIDSTLEIANLFADVDTALAESDDRDLLLASLPDIAGQMPWIMMNYAECGCLLAELLDIGQQEPYRHEQPKTGRNDPCFCGSGKKYKHCCLNAANDA